MTEQRIAYFVSPHGFGHAARACAVMESLHATHPGLGFDIYTSAPGWFFEASLNFPFRLHDLLTDVGLVQKSPLEEDLEATLRKLSAFIPFSETYLQSIARNLKESGSRLVVCDISPLGIAASHAARLPSILVENFTWDWIYEGYLDRAPRFSKFIPLFEEIFASADAHIKAEPFCEPNQRVALRANPVARKPRLTPREVRKRLQIPENAPAVLISMGGIEQKYEFLHRLTKMKDIWFVVPGGADPADFHNNLALVPHHSEYYHPDFVHACDAVISKAGYSTISEAYYAGIPYGYVSRSQFRESPFLSAFIREEMAGIEIEQSTFQSGQWIEILPQLLTMNYEKPEVENGADQIARFIFANYVR